MSAGKDEDATSERACGCFLAHGELHPARGLGGGRGSDAQRVPVGAPQVCGYCTCAGVIDVCFRDDENIDYAAC